MLIEENSARNVLRSSQSADTKDKISRAYGILTHSYQIDAIEALNAISLLKLGVEMGWVEGINRESINRLFLIADVLICFLSSQKNKPFSGRYYS